MVLSLKFVRHIREMRSFDALIHSGKETCSFITVKLEVKTVIYKNILFAQYILHVDVV